METKIQIAEISIEVLNATPQWDRTGTYKITFNIGFNARKYNSESFAAYVDSAEVEGMELHGSERMMALYNLANFNDALENKIYEWANQIQDAELVESSELQDFRFRATAAEMEKHAKGHLDFAQFVEDGELNSLDEVLQASYSVEDAVFRIKHPQGGDYVFFEVSEETFENDLELVHLFAQWAKED
jgi:hypothetical protein